MKSRTIKANSPKRNPLAELAAAVITTAIIARDEEWVEGVVEEDFDQRLRLTWYESGYVECYEVGTKKRQVWTCSERVPDQIRKLINAVPEKKWRAFGDFGHGRRTYITVRTHVEPPIWTFEAACEVAGINPAAMRERLAIDWDGCRDKLVHQHRRPRRRPRSLNQSNT